METQRLFLTPLNHCDNAFFIALVNSPGWLKFIGNRNIYSALDAQAYIQHIIDNPQYTYWTVHLKESQTSIGVLSLIKREYLDAHDIGFAFLPQFTNKGYAYEAAHHVIAELKKNQLHAKLYATTLAENKSSIKLLTRLGFQFVQLIHPKEECLNLYVLSEL
ncbi:GNAT family N-acetyltransferase [Myroides sp. WP-1]|uniref:GNAT family N-acetyltransferase n=1 Tax=Myroides sp. WP-1 TaxID=2759944 RepID=UPI0015FD1F9F|nr:GNAT family N-acetyltransferase [Myroides sp. WP-1]MBB1139867.1 GNAT family N-acetyltransferase [Myroides sp. WP-1]